jgi:hypothetical protein
LAACRIVCCLIASRVCPKRAGDCIDLKLSVLIEHDTLNIGIELRVLD